MKHVKKGFGIVAAAFVMASILAGCGNGAGGGSSSGKPGDGQSESAAAVKRSR